MNCPDCAAPTKVLDSRTKVKYKSRRRRCINCENKFNTREYPNEALIKFKAEYLALQDEVKKLRVIDKILKVRKTEFDL